MNRELQDKINSWPNRGDLPPVTVIIAYRNTVPLDVTPAKIGQLAGHRFK